MCESLSIQEVSNYEELEHFLRKFSSAPGSVGQYDFVGGFGLFLAILENLVQNHTQSNLEDLRETFPGLTENQKAFLHKLEP